MTSVQLISWVEDKLQKLGLQTKVLPPEQVVNATLKQAVSSKLDDTVTYMVRDAIAELFGMTIADIEREVRLKIGDPKIEANYEGLKRYLEDCPPEYWRHWVSCEARALERKHVADNSSVAHDFLNQCLGRVTKMQSENDDEDEEFS
jgi:hypothetical protein